MIKMIKYEEPWQCGPDNEYSSVETHMTEAAAIQLQRWNTRHKVTYPTDADALDDFMIIHWATKYDREG